MAHEAATTGRDELMEVMRAACALVAHADGRVDASERQRVLRLMRALPVFAAYSSQSVADEFDRHERAFFFEPLIAAEDALDAIKVLKPRASEVRMLILASQEMLEANGVHDPLEYHALQKVCKALGVA